MLVDVGQDNGLLNSILIREKDMKRKLPQNQEIYLPEYFSDTVAGFFEKSSDRGHYTGILEKLLTKRSKCRWKYF